MAGTLLCVVLGAVIRVLVIPGPEVLATYEVALVLLVDSSGAVLMQHRDDQTSVSPNQWSLPGGHVEPGETSRYARRIGN
ncbi:8-oxo-dGTP pyrophosphatase MutT (NUDIX family) [Actinoplanes tereljensis]|uniref:NUDIX domain-containing protein n=1 Tax=Paractinoplanes tereljensis TaxID=571912 RepID=UPI0023B2C492|nr:NUDIX domain-containing protein [Actinoplanes tereljensis]